MLEFSEILMSCRFMNSYLKDLNLSLSPHQLLGGVFCPPGRSIAKLNSLKTGVDFYIRLDTSRAGHGTDEAHMFIKCS